MSVAVVQGCSKGFGRALSRALLAKTQLHVVGTTSSGADAARSSILDRGDATPEGDHHRLTTVDLDVRREESIEKAARIVKDKYGNQLRLLVNVSGLLHAEKSLSAITYADLVDTFHVNTFGHLLVYKHFSPLLANRKDTQEQREDAANGVLKPGQNALVSISARVGSIGDNERGGWYSYRSSKAALNQIIRTLSHEMTRRSPQHPALCIAYHPGTMQTSLSAPYTLGQTPEDTKGLFEVEQAADNLLKFLSGCKAEMSGGFYAYDGSRVPW